MTRIRPRSKTAQLGGGSLLRRCLSAVWMMLSIWMQTSGTALLAVERCSLVRVWMAAQDSRSAYGLLYVAAVRDDRHRSVEIYSRVRYLYAPLLTCSNTRQ
jgi:hypothetical protein